MKTQQHYSELLKTVFLSLFMSSFVILFTGCDLLTNEDEDEEQKDELYVKFINDSNSLYTITNIQLQAMGKAGETSQPSGEWSENILVGGATIAAGAHKFFTLDIPNLHWSQYRLGVDNGNGNEILVYEQDGYQSAWELPITHWGSDERTVSVTIKYDTSSELIYISGYSDFAGIED